jgi:hypothetical protein
MRKNVHSKSSQREELQPRMREGKEEPAEARCPLPEWFREGRHQPPDATLGKVKSERDLELYGKLQYARGYLEAVNDLRKGLAKCRESMFLTLMAPYLRDVLLKADNQRRFAESVK